jgi:hypothetical protein
MSHDSGQKNSYETKLLKMKTVIGTALNIFDALQGIFVGAPFYPSFAE